jgi:hypothetical protein
VSCIEGENEGLKVGDKSVILAIIEAVAFRNKGFKLDSTRANLPVVAAMSNLFSKSIGFVYVAFTE